LLLGNNKHHLVMSVLLMDTLPSSCEIKRLYCAGKYEALAAAAAACIGQQTQRQRKKAERG